MKKVLITGINSYVGTNVEKWLLKEPDKYYVQALDMKDSNWVNFDFTQFDIVFHVAGIAHVTTKKNMDDIYMRVNRDLAVEVAKKSEKSGVKQFLFMSSMIVYNKKVSKITFNTLPEPNNKYGLSKLLAEQDIMRLEKKNFLITIFRPPIIYGKESKGNYKKLSSLAQKIKFFPKYENIRSMIYIDNFCECVKNAIEHQITGLLYPQNSEYVNTSDLVKEIALNHNKKVKLTKIFNPIIKILSPFMVINKLFGDFYYDKSMSKSFINYSVVSFKDSIKYSETENNYD